MDISNRGLDMGEFFRSGSSAISQRGEQLQQKMHAMMNKKEVSPQDMVMINFELGQYNALMESLSSVSKSLTDTLKSLSQRSG